MWLRRLSRSSRGRSPYSFRRLFAPPSKATSDHVHLLRRTPGGGMRESFLDYSRRAWGRFDPIRHTPRPRAGVGLSLPGPPPWPGARAGLTRQVRAAPSSLYTFPARRRGLARDYPLRAFPEFTRSRCAFLSVHAPSSQRGATWNSIAHAWVHTFARSASGPVVPWACVLR